jgi:non-heme chloroperoxidase
MRNRVRRSLNGSAVALCILLSSFATAGSAAPPPAKDKNPHPKSGFVTSWDGAKIHYVESGRSKTPVGNAEVGNPLPPSVTITKGNISVTAPHQFPSILFIPGWTMPAWIWEQQIAYFSKDFHVVAMDPRSQGESSQTHEGLYPAVRARDIKAVVDKLHLAPVVLVGWSMGVTEVAAYLDQFGSQDLDAVVLVDGYAGGTDPADAVPTIGILKSTLEDRKNFMASFMQKVMFKKPQPEDYIVRLTAASNITPTDAAVALLVGMHATDYKPALLKNTKPVLICVADSSIFATQLEDLHKRIPGARYEVFPGAGHTIFVDEPDKFNILLEEFITGLK